MAPDFHALQAFIHLWLYNSSCTKYLRCAYVPVRQLQMMLEHSLVFFLLPFLTFNSQ